MTINIIPLTLNNFSWDLDDYQVLIGIGMTISIIIPLIGIAWDDYNTSNWIGMTINTSYVKQFLIGIWMSSSVKFDVGSTLNL